MTQTSHPYKNSYATKRLRGLARTVEARIEATVKKGEDPPPELLEALMKALAEIERLEREPRASELGQLRQDLAKLDRRIGSLEAKDFGRAIR